MKTILFILMLFVLNPVFAVRAPSILVYIVDQNNDPIVGCKVELRYAETGEFVGGGETNLSGKVSLLNLKPNVTYEIMVSQFGYGYYIQEITPISGTAYLKLAMMGDGIIVSPFAILKNADINVPTPRALNFYILEYIYDETTIPFLKSKNIRC